jgi:hypothetical protein
MTNNTQAEQKAVETDTTQVESPTTESPITGDKTDVVVSGDQGTTTESSDDFPKDVEEQRRAFQEQRLEIKRLKEERESNQPKESAFDMFRAQTPVNPTGPIRIESYQDPITGETNWQQYNAAQQQREQQMLQQARFEASQEVDERMDEREARSKFPDLFNDKITEKQIASRWFYEKAQGHNVSISDIAGEFARNFKQAVSKAEKIGAERALNEVSEKEQAGLVASTQTSSPAKQAATASDQEDLVYRTRKGDESAIAARISKIPWANK